MKRLIAACQALRQALLASPMWSMLESEPVIFEFIQALEAEEKNATQTKVVPEAEKAS